MGEWTLCFLVRRTAQSREALGRIHRQVRTAGGSLSGDLGTDGYYHVDISSPVNLQESVTEQVQALIDAGLVVADSGLGSGGPVAHG